MKFAAGLGLAAGIVLAVWLLQSYGFASIFGLIGKAGWFGILAVIAFHLVQIVFSAAAWRMVAGPTQPRPSLGGFMMLRWIREGVNNLLPVAQIGGEFVASRLVHRRGVALPLAVAGTVCDLTMETVTQIAFTLFGLGLLFMLIGDVGIAHYVIGGLITASAAAAAFLAAQWLGLAQAIETGLMRLGKAVGFSGFGHIEGLHRALIGLYKPSWRLLWAASFHSISWLLGGVEICLALHFLGHDVSLGAGMVIESLGQAMKAAGFVVPGALGVQEGGLIVICRLFGLSPEVAIALSLMKRLREIGLGVPGLAVWQYLESRTRSPVTAISTGAGATTSVTR